MSSGQKELVEKPDAGQRSFELVTDIADEISLEAKELGVAAQRTNRQSARAHNESEKERQNQPRNAFAPIGKKRLYNGRVDCNLHRPSRKRDLPGKGTH